MIHGHATRATQTVTNAGGQPTPTAEFAPMPLENTLMEMAAVLAVILVNTSMQAIISIAVALHYTPR
jgi:hypothetical protein